MKNIIAAAFAVVAGIAAQGAWAQSLKIAVPHPGLWDSTVVEFAKQQGYFKNAGVDAEFFYTEGGGQQIQAVVSGSADIGLLNGLLSVMSAYEKGAPIRVISSEFTGAYDPYWYVLKDSPIKSLGDAGGHTVSFSVTGSSSHLTILSLLKQSGVKDAKLVATGGQIATLTQVMSGQIDIGFSVLPVGLKELEEGKIRIVGYGKDAKDLLGQSVRVNIANATALHDKYDAIAKVLAGFKRAIDDAYTDPKSLAWIAGSMGITPEQMAKIRADYYPRDAMQMGEIKGLDDALRDAYANKYLSKQMTSADMKGLFDLSVAPK